MDKQGRSTVPDRFLMADPDRSIGPIERNWRESVYEHALPLVCLFTGDRTGYWSYYEALVMLRDAIPKELERLERIDYGEEVASG